MCFILFLVYVVFSFARMFAFAYLQVMQTGGRRVLDQASHREPLSSETYIRYGFTNYLCSQLSFFIKICIYAN